MVPGPSGALGPWRPKADITEAEGRLNGGLGAEPPGKRGPFGSHLEPILIRATDF